MGRRRHKPYDPNKRQGRNGHSRRKRTNGHDKHDRRSFYHLPAGAEVVAAEIPDPYGTPSDATARREPGLHRDRWQAQGELEWCAPEAPRLVVVRSLRGDQIARVEARRQISQAQFEAGCHYQALHEAAFTRALHSLDLAARVIDKNRYGVEPFSDQQRTAIRRLNVINGSIVLRHGIDTLALVHAVLIGGRSVVDASRTLPRAKASYWRTALRLALDEIAAFAGLATKPARSLVPERYALQAAVMVATVGNGAP